MQRQDLWGLNLSLLWAAAPNSTTAGLGGFMATEEDLYMGISDQGLCSPFLLMSIYGCLPKCFPL